MLQKTTFLFFSLRSYDSLRALRNTTCLASPSDILLASLQYFTSSSIFQYLSNAVDVKKGAEKRLVQKKTGNNNNNNNKKELFISYYHVVITRTFFTDSAFLFFFLLLLL